MYEIWYDYMDTNSIIVHIKADEAGLKKIFFCHHSILGLQVGSVGRVFFILVEVSFIGNEPYWFFMWAWSWEKEPLSATIVIIDSDKAMVNECSEEIRFNWWAPHTRSISLETCPYLDLSLRDLSIRFIKNKYYIPIFAK